MQVRTCAAHVAVHEFFDVGTRLRHQIQHQVVRSHVLALHRVDSLLAHGTAPSVQHSNGRALIEHELFAAIQLGGFFFGHSPRGPHDAPMRGQVSQYVQREQCPVAYL